MQKKRDTGEGADGCSEEKEINFKMIFIKVKIAYKNWNVFSEIQEIQSTQENVYSWEEGFVDQHISVKMSCSGF